MQLTGCSVLAVDTVKLAHHPCCYDGMLQRIKELAGNKFHILNMFFLLNLLFSFLDSVTKISNLPGGSRPPNWLMIALSPPATSPNLNSYFSSPTPKERTWSQCSSYLGATYAFRGGADKHTETRCSLKHRNGVKRAS